MPKRLQKRKYKKSRKKLSRKKISRTQKKKLGAPPKAPPKEKKLTLKNSPFKPRSHLQRFGDAVGIISRKAVGWPPRKPEIERKNFESIEEEVNPFE